MPHLGSQLIMYSTKATRMVPIMQYTCANYKGYWCHISDEELEQHLEEITYHQ